ncbi:hypothetical protein B0H17DRAFT_1206495 [Mycena rosella]|uniref:peptidylprolyl isomerase n=1 Tax=Mycena rosella TaxID=1033263 RepID=A0AAD7D4U5_MYCRO|nr:hypothetical protein B0H17DRAFT_1206495 [Mycena rosella]
MVVVHGRRIVAGKQRCRCSGDSAYPFTTPGVAPSCMGGNVLSSFVSLLSPISLFLGPTLVPNRMRESLYLFESGINSRWFLRTSVVLLLNKIDVFKRKLLKGGDFARHNGTGGKNINGEKFASASLRLASPSLHGNASKNTNGSQFFVTTAVTEWVRRPPRFPSPASAPSLTSPPHLHLFVSFHLLVLSELHPFTLSILLLSLLSLPPPFYLLAPLCYFACSPLRFVSSPRSCSHFCPSTLSIPALSRSCHPSSLPCPSTLSIPALSRSSVQAAVQHALVFVSSRFLALPGLPFASSPALAPALLLPINPPLLTQLDGKHVVFAEVLSGMDLVRTIERLGSPDGTPKAKIVIKKAGVVDEGVD